MQGMALHTVEGDRADYDKFRKDFERIQLAATEKASAKDLLFAAGAANQALADYGFQTRRFIRQQTTLLHNMISMLMETIISIGAGDERSVECLREIEKELAKAVMLEDIQQLKIRLSACLQNLCEDAVQQTTNTEGNFTQIREQADCAHNCITETVAFEEQIDNVTGLGTQPAAKAAFEEALQSTGQKYVLAIVVNRIQSINSRFGHKVADMVLKTVLELLSLNLSSEDRLFRWSASAFVALLERDQTVDAVRKEIAKISSKNIERFFDVEGHPVLLPVTASSQVIPLSSSVTAISNSVESFVESHTENTLAYCR